jgi:hypothetical protein
MWAPPHFPENKEHNQPSCYKKGLFVMNSPFFYFTISSLSSSNRKLITWLAESRPIVTP